MIGKTFHTNGIIKSRGKEIGRVLFGIWEYFDENGNLIKTVDEDEKFGKIKPQDIVGILNKNEVINTQEGTSAATYDKKFNTTGEEITAPLWRVIYSNSSSYCVCDIDGNTGEFKKGCGGVILRY